MKTQGTPARDLSRISFFQRQRQELHQWTRASDEGTGICHVDSFLDVDNFLDNLFQSFLNNIFDLSESENARKSQQHESITNTDSQVLEGLM